MTTQEVCDLVRSKYLGRAGIDDPVGGHNVALVVHDRRGIDYLYVWADIKFDPPEIRLEGRTRGRDEDPAYGEDLVDLIERYPCDVTALLEDLVSASKDVLREARKGQGLD